MANGPTLPPQAYTREILTSAFNWLQSQPESVRKLATNPDALVGLFMRAQRFGSSSLETDAPVSSVNFMSDLKNLAEGLKQFEGPKRAVVKTAAAINAAPRATLKDTYIEAPREAAREQTREIPVAAASWSAVTHPSAQTSSQINSQTNPAELTPAPTSSAHNSTATSEGVSMVHWNGLLNERTCQMIREVKKSLNLSSEAEVVNMMTALAYKSLKDLLV